MTNKQAFNLASICGILTNSKQLSFGTIRRLSKNAKVIETLSKEVQEINKLGAEKEKSKEEIEAEIAEFENEEFKGEFEQIKLDLVDDVKSEIISLKGYKDLDINVALLILEQNNLLA